MTHYRKSDKKYRVIVWRTICKDTKPGDLKHNPPDTKDIWQSSFGCPKSHVIKHDKVIPSASRRGAERISETLREVSHLAVGFQVSVARNGAVFEILQINPDQRMTTDYRWWPRYVRRSSRKGRRGRRHGAVKEKDELSDIGEGVRRGIMGESIAVWRLSQSMLGSLGNVHWLQRSGWEKVMFNEPANEKPTWEASGQIQIGAHAVLSSRKSTQNAEEISSAKSFSPK